MERKNNAYISIPTISNIQINRIYMQRLRKQEIVCVFLTNTVHTQTVEGYEYLKQITNKKLPHTCYHSHNRLYRPCFYSQVRQVFRGYSGIMTVGY